MLDAKNFGLGAGVYWGLACFVMALIGKTGYGISFIDALGTMYIGYQPGLVGALLGLVYGFLDGFVAGFVIAYIYNMFDAKKSNK